MIWRRTASLCVALSFATSCGTLYGRKQRVKLATVPPGAAIYVDGEPVGESNAFVPLATARTSKVEVRRQGYRTQEVELVTSYRWGESFVANTVWFYLAPVGWAIDLLSGGAWEYEPQPVIVLTPSGAAPAVDGTPRARRILVTPPRASFEPLSGGLAERLAAEANRRYPGDVILTHDAHQSAFYAYGWDHEDAPDSRLADKLYDELSATHVLTAEAAEDQPVLQVATKLTDIFTGKDEDAFVLTFGPDELVATRHGWVARTALFMVSWVPNTVALDLTSPTLALTAEGDDATYRLTKRTSEPLLALLTGVMIRNVRSSTTRDSFGAYVTLGPVFSGFFNRLHLDIDPDADALPNEEARLNWYAFSVGFGPELGVETLIGCFYFGLYPHWGVHVIDGTVDGRHQRLVDTAFTAEAELGYLFFVTRNLHLRLFARAYDIPADTWRAAFARFDRPAAIRDDQSYYVTGGISIGYFFPELRAWTKAAVR